jgi:hypothetical protein
MRSLLGHTGALLCGAALLGAADDPTPSLRYALEILPGPDDVSADAVWVDQSGTTMGVFGVAVFDTWFTADAHGVDADTTYGVGVAVDYVRQVNAGPLSLICTGGTFVRYHRTATTERLTTTPLLTAFAPLLVTPAPTFASPYAVYEVKNDAYLATGLGVGVGVALDLEVLVLEAGPFVDIGVGMGLGTEAVGTNALGIPPAMYDPLRDDTSVSPGLYLTYGLEVNAVADLDGMQLGGGLFYLLGDGEDSVDLDTAYTTFTPAGAVSDGRATCEYDRAFEFNGVGAKVLLSIPF